MIVIIHAARALGTTRLAVTASFRDHTTPRRFLPALCPSEFYRQNRDVILELDGVSPPVHLLEDVGHTIGDRMVAGVFYGGYEAGSSKLLRPDVCGVGETVRVHEEARARLHVDRDFFEVTALADADGEAVRLELDRVPVWRHVDRRLVAGGRKAQPARSCVEDPLDQGKILERCWIHRKGAV